jgi:hypothetical protein
VHTQQHTAMYTYECTVVLAHTRSYVHTCSNTHVHILAHTCTCHTRGTHYILAHTRAHGCTQCNTVKATCACALKHAHTCIHTVHTHTHTHAQTYTLHTRVHTHLLPRSTQSASAPCATPTPRLPTQEELEGCTFPRLCVPTTSPGGKRRISRWPLELGGFAGSPAHSFANSAPCLSHSTSSNPQHVS